MPGLDIYLHAYDELKYDKPVGMAVGPIPWSSIDRWASRHDIDDADDVALLVYFVREIDNAMEASHREKEKNKNGKRRKVKT